VIYLGKVWSNNLVDTETGEKLYTYQKRGVERINEKGYLFKSNANKATTYEFATLPEELSDDAIGKVYRLKGYIGKNTNMLRIRKSKGYYPMERKDFEKVWGLKKRQTNGLLNKLINLGVIAQNTIEVEYTIRVQYYMNPMYFHNGSRISPILYDMFKEQLRPHFPQWVVDEFERELNK
jgi:hypothetical protein